MTADAKSAPPPPPQRRSRGKRWLLVGLGFCVLLWLALPFVVSAIGRGIAERQASAVLGSSVTVGNLDFGWFSGVDVSGVLVAEPERFASSPAAFEVDRIQAKVGLLGMLRGRYDVFARIEAPRLHVVRGREGEINWLELLGSAAAEAPVPAPPPAEPRDSEPKERGPKDDESPLEIPPVHLDVLLTDGRVVIEDEASGTQHALENLRVEITTEGNAPPVRLNFAADVTGGERPGSLRLEASFDPATDAVSTAVFTTAGLDLAPYQPLLRSFGVELDRLEGVFDGNLSAELRPAGGKAHEVVLGGSLVGTEVHASGPLLEEREFDFKKVQIDPALRIDAATGAIDATDFSIDAGFLRVAGLSPADRDELFEDGANRAAALGLSTYLVIQGLAGQKGLLPPDLAGSRGTMELQLAVRGDLNPTSPSFLAQPLEVRLEGQGRKVKVESETIPAGVVPPNFDLHFPVTLDPTNFGVTLQGGRVSFQGSEIQLDATLAGEAVTAKVKGELAEPYVEVLAAAYSPADLSPKGSLKLDSEIHTTLPLDTEDLSALLHAANTQTKVQIPTLAFLENRLSGLELGIGLADGALHLSMPTAALLNGGEFTIGASLDADDATQWPVHLDFSWKGGDAGGSFAPLLRYAVPLLAGLESAAGEGSSALDLKTGIDLGLRLSGPAKKNEGGSWLEYLSAFAGSGELALRDGSFTPAGPLSKLVELGGDKGKLRFSTLSTKFDVDKGSIQAPSIQVRGEKASQYSLSGQTALSGDMDYRLDLSGILAGKGIDEKLRAALGDQKLEAVLNGSLTSPKLDLGATAQKLLDGVTQNLLQDLTQDPGGTVDKLKGLLKKKDGE